MLHIFCSEITPDLLLPVTYPKERVQDIDSAALPALRDQKTAVWNLLITAVSSCLELEFDSCVFSRQQNGKWTCDRFFFSLSHTHYAVAVAISDQPVGIDLENLTVFQQKNPAGSARLERLRKRICGSGEYSLCTDPASFLRLWTAKEAVFKASDASLFSPSALQANAFPVISAPIDWHDRYIISVCSPEYRQAQWHGLSSFRT